MSKTHNSFSKSLLETIEAGILIQFNYLKKRNIIVNGRKTSVTLEPLVWEIFHDIAESEQCHINDLCEFIAERKHEKASMASAIRIFVIGHLGAKSKNNIG